jgi:hypothetical protein
VPGSGRPLPFGTRTLLQVNAPATRQPLEFVVVAELPTGTRGEVFQVSWAVEAQPVGGPGAGGGYIEGCWNFKPTAAEHYPGLVVYVSTRTPPPPAPKNILTYHPFNPYQQGHCKFRRKPPLRT